MTQEKGKLPRHVAIILDGNRRWARKKGLPAIAGHRKVVEERIEELIERAAEVGIPYITFWCFSTENWEREGKEVAGIMKLFMWALKHKAKRLIERGARVKMIGDLTRFDEKIQAGFGKLVEGSKDNAKITVTFALNYGGRDEIVRAVRKLATGDSRLATRELISRHLDTFGTPDPDLIIRPGGERRLSGFMLWQAEYAELYFTQVLMPDFGKEELDKAVEEFGRRQRRRGR
jgi:undecaprenyl diphosphate synthase